VVGIQEQEGGFQSNLDGLGKSLVDKRGLELWPKKNEGREEK